MLTFFVGLVVLIVGGYAYSLFVERRIYKPDDRITPAFTHQDGVDYVPMKTWRNSLINLLNIAGTGPVIGPIQGILFGPIAFILIPIGCVLAGSVHDYSVGMISLRNNGAQMPKLMRKFTNAGVFRVYMVFVAILLFLVATVFVVTPTNLFSAEILNRPNPGAASDWVTWLLFAVVFAYYGLSTVLPIQQLIGKVYPLFGFLLVFSAIGMFVMMVFGLFNGSYTLYNLSVDNWRGIHPGGLMVFPMFFLTVACGILSGFHATQNTMIARSVGTERHARHTYFNMMLFEGFIAMVWAAGAMVVMNLLSAQGVATPAAIPMVGYVATELLGPLGVATVAAVIVLALTSGDTCLRSLRIIAAENLKFDQKPVINRLKLTFPIMIVTAGLLAWTTFANDGFNILWRYFAWANQTLGVFALAMATIYLLAKGHTRAFLITLLPGCFYFLATVSFILSADIGFRLPWPVALSIAGAGAIAYAIFIYRQGTKVRGGKEKPEVEPVYNAKSLPATGR